MKSQRLEPNFDETANKLLTLSWPIQRIFGVKSVEYFKNTN